MIMVLRRGIRGQLCAMMVHGAVVTHMASSNSICYFCVSLPKSAAGEAALVTLLIVTLLVLSHHLCEAEYYLFPIL